jgi:hypothetical protein
MRETVRAEDGDEVSVVTTAVSLDQEIVQIEIENHLFDSVDGLSLQPDRARALARALITAADVVEYRARVPLSLNLGSFSSKSEIPLRRLA